MTQEDFDLEKYSNLLNKARDIIIPYKHKWQKSGEYFNFFEALGIERKEVRHSALLATLLNPMAIHGMEDCFLRAFVQKIDYSDFPTKRAIVKTEEVINGGRRLDISIVSEDGKKKIVIENKIDTNDHDNQLNEYLKDLKTFESYRLVYLTINGELPYEEIDENEIICISYREDILQLLENIVSSDVKVPDPIHEIIRQYIITIKNLTNQGVDKEMNKQLMELLITDNNFELVEKMYKQLNEIKIEVLTRFIILLKNKFETHNRNVSIQYKSETNYVNAVARYAMSTSNNESEYLLFSFNLISNKTFYITFAPDGWFWNEIKDKMNPEYKETTEQFWALGPKFDTINFRFPEDGFKKFANMSETEQEDYISAYVNDIESRLKEMKL